MSKILLFNYGSNHPAQLKERIGEENVGTLYAAYAEGYQRVFRGYSGNWGGSVATIIKKPSSTVYGYVSEITSQGLKNLLPFEGTKYAKKEIKVLMNLGDDEFVEKKAVAFIRKGNEPYGEDPSSEYLNAVLKTINVFWDAKKKEIILR